MKRSGVLFEKWDALHNGNYDNQASQLVLENLEGKLLMTRDMIDTTVPHSNTMLVVATHIAEKGLRPPALSEPRPCLPSRGQT